MLRPAILFKDELIRRRQEIFYDPRFKYYEHDVYCSTPEIVTNTYNALQMVSVCKDRVIGFFDADIYRAGNLVKCLEIVNFDFVNPVFSRDFYTFMTDLFLKYHFRKVKFSVLVGNPAQKLYDWFIDYYGGTVCGVNVQDLVLWDGSICDKRNYEIFNDKFMERWNQDGCKISQNAHRLFKVYNAAQTSGFYRSYETRNTI